MLEPAPMSSSPPVSSEFAPPEAKAPTVTRAPPAGRQFPCPQCGARLDFDPKAQALQCPYCGHTEAVTPAAGQPEEQDWEAYWKTQGGKEVTLPGRPCQVACAVCGAVVLLEDRVAAGPCPYCGTFLENKPE